MAGGSSKTYTPNFYITINGHNFTPYTIGWQLDDIDDGISTLHAKFANPDGIISGYIRTESDITLRYGYWDGKMSKPVTMKIKDLSEDYPTQAGCTISVTAYDCVERLMGVTHAGNSDPDATIPDELKSLLEGAKIKPDVQGEGPKKMPERTPLHNMTSHAGVRWLMGHMKCKGDGGGGENNPVSGQKEYNAGDKFKEAESVTGDRGVEAQLRAELEELKSIYIKNQKKRAGDSVITGRLDIVGYPGIEAKKCITILNVGEQASGKWYVKKSSQKYDTGSGYTTILDLMRGSVDKDGKSKEQPIVMHAKIYDKDTVFIGCRDIDGESQGTFTFGQPDENGDELVMHFRWQIKLQGSRSAAERQKIEAYMINKAKELQQSEAKKTGSWNAETQSPPPAEQGQQ